MNEHERERLEHPAPMCCWCNDPSTHSLTMSPKHAGDPACTKHAERWSKTYFATIKRPEWNK
jgi:hypothetical protein